MHVFRIALGIGALLLFAAQFAYAAVSVRGVVRDPSGAPLKDADVSIATAERSVVASTKTDAEGAFVIDVPAPGIYLVSVTAAGFAEARQSVTIAEAGTPPLDVVLRLGQLEDEVTVTAVAGLVQDIRTAGQPVNVIDARSIAERVDTVVAEAVKEEAGVHLQRTSPTMAGIFVRGLT